ncbi:MAG: hypothetical protein QOK22_3295 [Gaiellaceae bacterium]|nr:hypothetical protein [Gaiellaceae bacterium]
MAAAGCGGSSSSTHAGAGLPVVVLQSPDAPSWVRLMRSVGWSVREGDLKSLLGRGGGIVPGDATLSGSDRSKLVDWVAEGGRLATAQSALIAAFGIGRGPAQSIDAVTMKELGGKASWATPLTLQPLTGKGLDELASPVSGGGAAMASKHSGSGVVVAFAVDPVGDGRQGYELLPQAASLVGDELAAPVGPKAQTAQVFVDTGGLPKSLRSNPARIASLLSEAGVRVAEIAAWNYDFTDPANNTDYKRLIDALHARGILAYAWLEPPFVTLRLWQDHPECREKTKTGRDAYVDWRSLIALENPACFALATESWTRILTRYAWDGVNMAELYFEPDVLDRNFTPFSASALAQFGGDPAKDPQGFLRFRTNLVTALNRKVLHFVSTLPHASHLGLELTVIDDTLDPALGQGVGSDVAALAAVARHAGATLVVEDPHSAWSEGPLRYDKLGPHVASLMPPQGALLDVNVVPRYGGPKPTAQMTGAELGLALGSATAPLGKLGIYSLGTVPERDLLQIPGSMAASTSTTDLGVYGRWTVAVTAPSPGDGRLSVDGIDWPATKGHAIVPGGNHVLAWAAGDPIGPGLVSFTGELGTARVSKRQLTLSYDTRPDGLAVVTERPTALSVDGKPARLEVVSGPAGYVVRVPTGNHDVVLDF